MAQMKNWEKQCTNSVSHEEKVLNEYGMGAFGAYITIDRNTWYRHIIYNTLKMVALSVSEALSVGTPNAKRRYKCEL